MRDYQVKITCKVNRHKMIKKTLCIAARSYREAVSTARGMVKMFGRVRVSAWVTV